MKKAILFLMLSGLIMACGQSAEQIRIAQKHIDDSISNQKAIAKDKLLELGRLLAWHQKGLTDLKANLAVQQDKYARDQEKHFFQSDETREKNIKNDVTNIQNITNALQTQTIETQNTIDQIARYKAMFN